MLVSLLFRLLFWVGVTKFLSLFLSRPRPEAPRGRKGRKEGEERREKADCRKQPPLSLNLRKRRKKTVTRPTNRGEGGSGRKEGTGREETGQDRTGKKGPPLQVINEKDQSFSPCNNPKAKGKKDSFPPFPIKD